MEQEIEEVNNSIQASTDFPPISLERAQSILEQQKLFIEELTGQQKERKRRVAAIVSAVQAEEAEVAKLKATLGALQIEAARVAELEKGRDLALEAKRNTLVGMRDLVTRLSGFRVQQAENDFEFTVTYSIPGREGPSEVVCTIVTDPSTGSFVGVHMEDSQVEIDDIVENGMENNDLSYVVTELQFRLANFAKRTREFQELEERFDDPVSLFIIFWIFILFFCILFFLLHLEQGLRGAGERCQERAPGDFA